MSIDPEYPKHQYLYVPWIQGHDLVEAGKAIGLHVAKQHKARLTVVCPRKSSANDHDEFAKLPVVTERSGQVADGGVVLAWCPTRKVMDKLHHLEKSVVVLVEWPTENFEAWAKLVGAYNVVTREVMDANLTTSRLKELDALREYDRAIIVEYASHHRGQTSLQRLEKILDRFERSRVTA